jgi:lipopolysaccharide transport system ATP-binding protein
MDQMLISTHNLSQYFQLSGTGTALSLFRIITGKTGGSSKQIIIKAVDNVSIRIDEGERVGIIGHNGAGKSTLLQMIAGLLEPTAGHLKVQGHVNCIMSLGVGLREDLSGRENIYIDGEINNKSSREVSEIIDDIIAFAGIGEFIDYPVKTYSSGMKSRLAFSMIIHIDPEILIIDEALSAGDASFSAKATAKMKEITEKGNIHIIVSHSMSTIVEMCNRCLWMDHGKIIMDGNPFDVTEAYVEKVREIETVKLLERFKKRIGGTSTVEAEITDLSFLDHNRKAKLVFTVGEEMTVSFSVMCSRQIKRPDFRLYIERVDGVLVTENSSLQDGMTSELSEGESKFEVHPGPLLYGKNTYEVTLRLFDCDETEDKQLKASMRTVLKVENYHYSHTNPVFCYPVTWKTKEDKALCTS